MKKKRLFKSLVLLFASSFTLGTLLSLQLAHKKDNINVASAYEGTKLPSSGGTLSSGTYYLDEDVTLTNYINVATGNNIIINLNGFSLSAKPNSNQAIVYVKGGTLTINGKDDVSGNMGTLCNGTGYYDGSYTRGGAIAIYADGTNVSNVTINDCNIGNNTAAFAGAMFICKGSTATLNNCNVYNNDSTSDPSYGYRGAIYVEDASSTVNINGGEIYNNEGGVLLWGNNSQSSSANLNGVYVHDNTRFGVRLHGSDNGNAPLTIAGDTIIKNNPTESSTEQANLRLNGSNRGKFTFPSGLGDNACIGITMQGTNGVFTSGWSQYMGDADPSAYFFSDSTDVIIGKNPSGELLIGVPRTVTYTSEHGTAPDSDTVADGSIIVNEPTSPSEEGYEFKGWYKDPGFENAWDFETDAITEDTTLYAKWEGYDPAVANVIKLINDIGDLTYAGGANDSLDDIIAAKAAYDALTPEQKEVVNGVNKDVLDHDIVTYNHVDKVGDLIKAIPEASDSQEYYDAVDAALAAYDALSDEEEAILNAAIDFQYKKTLDDNIAVKEVIELIQDIGEVTYKGGQDDSKDDINDAIDAYNNLADDLKAIVNNVNKDELDDAKETYDNVDEAVNLINSIGDINHGGDNDSKDAIDAARETYDNLSDEEKTLVNSYNDSTQTLKDAEEVYDVLVKIDDIGEVTADSGDKIAAAREAYEALSDEQKDKVNSAALNTLKTAETKYLTNKQDAELLFRILLFISILLIISGLIVLSLLLKNRANNKKKLANAYSFAGFLPLLAFVSGFGDSKFIIAYILLGLAILIWTANFILILTRNRVKEPKVMANSVTQVESRVDILPPVLMNLNNEEDDEVVTTTDEKGNIFQIRYIRSFKAKLIQSPDETKKYYEELKNEVLSYKKTNSRISWHYDSVTSSRNPVVKFAIRGKTLCVYFPLNVDEYSDSKYKVEKVESKKFEDVPCLYRIKNDRRLGYAKELIAVVTSSLGLEKGEEQHEVYSNLPYEPNKPLIARGLIKEQKVQVNKPSEQPVVLESKVNSDGDEVVVAKDASGNIFEIRYIKSFTAKLSQSEDVVKDYYTILKNYALSYKDSHSRVSWHYDAINVGREYVLKFAIRGKTLCLYYALDVSKLDEKYKVEEAKGKKFEDVPCLYRIKNERRLNYAKELIDLLMSEKAISKGREQNEDYHIPTESTKALLAKGLIKEVKSKVKDKEVIKHYESISVSKADEEMSDEKAESSIEEIEVIKPRKGSKEIINIDTLSENYNNGDEVTLESLIKKGLVPTTTGHIKVLARGVLDKKLDVIANDFSIPAIKMIVLVGGHVKKIK